MASSYRKSVAVPDGWADAAVRGIVGLCAGFVALNTKEWLDSGQMDILGCAIDGAWVGGVTFVFNAILIVTSGGARRTDDRVAMPVGR